MVLDYCNAALSCNFCNGLGADVTWIQNLGAREKLVPDGLHPNDDGHGIIAEEMLAFLRAV